MLQDAYGRRFYYLRLSITDVCNFRCQYCLPDGYQGLPEASFLTLPEITKTVQAFATLGTQKVRLTGGEPSLRRDLPTIIERVSDTPGIDHVALTSNGYKIQSKLDDWVSAGLNQLNVSIDSLDPAVFHEVTGHNQLDDVLGAVDKALTLGLKVKINAVLLKNLNTELTPYFKWLKTTPVTFRFIEVMETGDQAVFFRQYHQSGGTIKQRLLEQGWQPVLREKHAGPAQEFWHPDYRGRFGLIMPYSNDFCTTCNRLRVSSLGKLHLCLFSEQGIDLRHLMQDDTSAQDLAESIEQYITGKAAGHALKEHQSGAMKNLSMIGG